MEDVTVEVGPCRCPGSPHPHDWVKLAPVLDVPIGMGAKTAMKMAVPKGEAAVYGALAEAYMALAIRSWSFTDEAGEPVENTAANRLIVLPYNEGGELVAERCDDLYGRDLLSPLAQPTSRSSTAGQPATPTSATSGSGRTHRTPSRRSSHNGSAGQPSAAPVS